MSRRRWKIAGFAFLLIFGLSFGRGQAEAGDLREVKGIRLESRDVERPYSLTSISGPMIGMVFDHAREGFRIISGIPGASSLGDVLDIGVAISRAWISPQQEYALVEIKDNQELMLIGPHDKQLSLRSIPGATSGAEKIALSPTGASAVLYRRGTLQLIAGLPHKARLTAEIDVSKVPEPLDALAVSDDGGAVLVGVSGQDSGALYLATERGEVWNISALGRASAISFLRNTRNALLADRRANEILIILDVTGTAEKLTVAGELQGIREPVAVQISDDNRRVFIANSELAAVLVLDLETATVKHLPCDGIPSGFYRMGTTAVFRLMDVSEKPLLLLEDRDEAPRIVFVPFAN
jgi:hypothetical protein